MSNSEYVLICSTPGTSMRRSVVQVQNYLKALGKSVDHRDVEESCGIPIRELLLGPKSEVVDVWNRGLQRALLTLSNDSEIRLISCHLTLYDKHKSALFAPGITSNFLHAEQKPTQLVMLIDDIFDMAHRLGGSNDLFDESLEYERIQTRMTKVLSDSYPTEEESRTLNALELELCKLDASISVLQRMLYWRRSEMIVAENLALQLGIPLTLLGIKHPMNMVRPLLDEGVGKCVTYVSHPISRLRLEQQQNSSWSQIAHRLNQIPGRLAGKNVVSIMPTAIDEFRFVSPDQDNAFLRRGGMIPRWPLIESDDGLVGYDQAEVPSSLQMPDEVKDSLLAECSIYLRGLEVSITTEIPFRDHYLVNHCPHFFAFRPRENGNWWSRGVEAELEHFALLAERDQSRRMVIIHDRSDVVKAIELLQNSSNKLLKKKLESAVELTREYIRSKLPTECNVVGTDEAVHSVLFDSRLPDSLLDERTTSNQQISEFRNMAIAAARQNMLISELALVKSWKSWLRVKIVDTNNWSFVDDVADWLRTGSPLQYDFYEEISQACDTGTFDIWFSGVFENYLRR